MTCINKSTDLRTLANSNNSFKWAKRPTYNKRYIVYAGFHRRPVVSGGYARGSKRSHIGGKCVMHSQILVGL